MSRDVKDIDKELRDLVSQLATARVELTKHGLPLAVRDSLKARRDLLSERIERLLGERSVATFEQQIATL